MDLSIDKGPTARNLVATVLAVLLLATMVTVSGPVAPAQAACGDTQYGATYVTSVSGYYWSSAREKLGASCYDGNVRYSSKSTTHRGQWLSNAQTWQWSSAGSDFLIAGWYSPVKVMIDGSISVGRLLRVGTIAYNGEGIWWF